MPYTDITIGRLTLRETFELSANISAGTDTRTLVLAGQESSPPLAFAQVKQRQEDLLGLQNRLVPIRFGTKSDHDGWYRITDANSNVVDYQGSEVRSFNWSLNAQFIGPENAVDLESRLTGIQRQNDFGLTGSKWHAPAAGHGGFMPAGVAWVDRPISDGGNINVYRSLPASANPRWHVSLASYQKGRVRILVDGVERTGINMRPTTFTWELSNGLMKITPSGSATWNMEFWDGSAWESKAWNMSVSSSSGFAVFDQGVSVLRNDYEVATLRMLGADYFQTSRASVDLTLRRGARFVEGRLFMPAHTNVWIQRATAEAATAPASSGYVRATSNDAAGNRFVCGSARNFSALTTQGGFEKFTSTFEFFIGSEVGGSAAVAGDTAADLVGQYLTSMGEVTQAALR
jgi:hypothetical protein